MVGDDEAVCAWLASRGFDPALVEDRDLARVLPSGRLPRWASHWRSLSCGLVLPLSDARGQLASLRGRRVVDGEGPKSVAARGVRSAGLVLADGTAAALLRGDAWVHDAVETVSVIVAEGEPDWLTWAMWVGEVDSAPAVLGIPGSGAWTTALAARIPDGARVVVRTHDDAAGHRYAEAIGADLSGRCRVLRAHGGR